MSVRGFGPGKVILVGEHAVVYGHPAVAFAVDRGTTATLTPVDGPTRILTDGPQDDALLRAVHHTVGTTGVQVALTSTLPIGRGMGSSASLAVALVRAKALWDGEPAPTPEQVFERALPLERIFHRNPSGLDVAVAAGGGALRYVRAAPPVLQRVAAPTGTWVVLDTGDVGNTADLVAHVGSQRPGIDPILDRIGALVDEALAVLDTPAGLGALLNENHTLLRQIGVSTSKVEELVQLALKHGALGAKLSGAGGGGIVLALVHDPAPLQLAAQTHGIPTWVCTPVGAS